MDLELFTSSLRELGISVDTSILYKLDKYYNLLIDWNKKMNLTSIVDKDMVYLKHFYDSITITKVIDLNDVDTVCDVGTGAGFPGIILKIFFPHIKLTLVDSLGKRILFLNEVIRVLDLKDVKVLHVRAEEYSRNVREKYDLVTARAVSSFNILLELCIPMIKKNKFFVAMRGFDDLDSGINALDKLNCTLIKKECFYLPIENSSRTLALVLKNDYTDLKYPRKYSEIKKKPL